MRHTIVATLTALAISTPPATADEINAPMPKRESILPNDPLDNDNKCGAPDAVRTSLQRRHGLRHFLSLAGTNHHGAYAVEIWTDEPNGRWAAIVVPADGNIGSACLADSGERGVYQWVIGRGTPVRND